MSCPAITGWFPGPRRPTWLRKRASSGISPEAVPTQPREGGLVITYPERQKGYGDQSKFRLTGIYVRHLIKAVEDSGSSIMFFYLPMAPEIEEYRQNGAISPDEAAFTAIIKKQGKELKSLTPVLAASAEPLTKLYFVPRDGHWTARGQALAAQYMGAEIKRRLQPSRAARVGGAGLRARHPGQAGTPAPPNPSRGIVVIIFGLILANLHI